MSTVIYYFSGTGNSYIVAKDIAKRLGAELKSIPKVMKNDSIKIDADKVGIIFPSYLAPVAGLPLIVERFVKRIININSIHIFAVCTCGGYECVNAIPSLHKLRKVIKSCRGKLTEEYSVRLPMNNLDYDHIPIPILKDTDEIIKKSKIKIDRIYNRIISKKGTSCRAAKELLYMFMKPIYKLIQTAVINDLKEKAKVLPEEKLTYFELMPLTDNSISIDDKCKGCGTCVKVCPVNNIVIVEHKPEFLHHCELCFACDEWCPSKAIHHWSRADGVKYHHPEVKISDFIEQS